MKYNKIGFALLTQVYQIIREHVLHNYQKWIADFCTKQTKK